jgi:hypothetical protein
VAQSYNLKHTTTLVINQAYDYNTPRTNWFTDQPFLAGLIPLQEDSAYRIEQVKKKSKTNSVDALLNIIDYQ